MDLVQNPAKLSWPGKPIPLFPKHRTWSIHLVPYSDFATKPGKQRVHVRSMMKVTQGFSSLPYIYY